MSNAIQEIHRVFCDETGLELRMGIGEYSRERSWFDFLKAGFTADDLRLVIRHLKKKIVAGERRPGALKFSNLIERLESFEEEVALARAEQRNAKAPPRSKTRTVAMLRPSVKESTPKTEAKPIADYIQQLRKAAQ